MKFYVVVFDDDYSLETYVRKNVKKEQIQSITEVVDHFDPINGRNISRYTLCYWA